MLLVLLLMEAALDFEDGGGEGAGLGVGDVMLQGAVFLQGAGGAFGVAQNAVGCVEEDLEFGVQFGVVEFGFAEAASED